LEVNKTNFTRNTSPIIFSPSQLTFYIIWFLVIPDQAEEMMLQLTEQAPF
jgi:hypothetical protein